MQLIRPDLRFRESYLAYIREMGEEERYPFVMDLPCEDFPALLHRLDEISRGINLPAGSVPSSTFWLVEQEQLLGVSNLRHCLNEQIREVGGHIGLGIRPSRRGQGLGRALLALTLEQARKLGIDQVHIHCYQDNQASGGLIRAMEAVRDSQILAAGKVVERFILTPQPQGDTG